MKELIKLNQKLLYFNISIPDEELFKDISPFFYVNSKYKVEQDDISIKLWHQDDVHTRPARIKHYGFPIFELDTFKKKEIASMKLCDEIITCSKWGADIVESSTGVKCNVVPLGIDSSIFSPTGINPIKNTIFFNAGKWEVRKSHEEIIECFNRAFEYSDNVELWLLCHNIFLEDGGKYWIDLCKKSKLYNKIKILPRQNTQKDVYNIMQKTDVGIFPSKAEGWNLELLEMMSIGKHVIATNYSAHTEYCTAENSNLVRVDTLEKAIDGKWFHGDGNWAYIGESQKDEIINHMRTLHRKKQDGVLGINSSGIETGRKYSWKNSAERIIKLL